MMADHPPALTLDELTREIYVLSRRWLQDYIAIGARLKQVKAMLTHGAWLHWLAEDAPFSVSTAERCMRADDLAQSHPELADPRARIEVSAIDLLTAKQTPATVVTRVIRVARQGTLISQQYVRAELDKQRRPRPAPPKSSTLENVTPTPALPEGISFADDDNSPSVEEMMRRASQARTSPPRTVERPLDDWTLVLEGLRGFLDWEAELEEALDGPLRATGLAPMWSAEKRARLSAVLAGLKDDLEAPDAR